MTWHEALVLHSDLFKNFFFANGIHLRMRMRKLHKGNLDGQESHILFGVPSSLKRSGARRRAVSSLVKTIRINAAKSAAGDLLMMTSAVQVEVRNKGINLQRKSRLLSPQKLDVSAHCFEVAGISWFVDDPCR